LLRLRGRLGRILLGLEILKCQEKNDSQKGECGQAAEITAAAATAAGTLRL
jgi:hypothetical protein